MKSFYQHWKLDHDLPMAIHRATNLSFYPHFHTEVEFIYVESGSIVVGVNEDKRLLHQGDMAICSSNDIHYFDSKDRSSRVIFVIFHPEMVGRSMNWPSDFRFASPFISRDHPGFGRVEQLLHRILQEKSEEEPGYRLLIQASLLELCGTLQRHLPLHPQEKGSLTRISSKRARMQQILSYIEEHYQEELSVEQISGHFRMEPSYFCRTFKQAIGMNFKTYLGTVRVLNAKNKLENTDDTITEIALECGFGSIRTFNRVYKDLQGHPPSALRRNNH